VKIDKTKIEYKIECLTEETQIEGNASAINEETDARIAADIRERLENGNQWAWCTVRVTASIEGITLVGENYLGCCSYESEDDFCAEGGYFEDMKSEAKAELLEKIQDVASFKTTEESIVPKNIPACIDGILVNS